MAEVILNDDNFNEEVFGADGLVLVDFYAEWCGPCKMMEPVLGELAKEYEGKRVKICKLDIEKGRNIAAKYGVMSVPTFMFFKRGNVLEQVVGGMPKESLKEKVDDLIRG